MKDRVLRLTEEDLEVWRAHPVTEAVFGFLKDRAGEVRSQWYAGEGWTDQAKMYVEIMEGVPALTLPEMRAFYEEDNDDPEQGDDPGSG